jgi:type II secretory ATPase GspE/PulE/Tfp pilus assembly ATPase PilB-like protein
MLLLKHAMNPVPFAASAVDRAAYAEFGGACRTLGFLPAFRDGILLDAAMVDPHDESALAAIRRLTHQEVRAFGISREDFESALAGLDDSAAGEGEGDLPGPPPSCPESWECHRLGGREVAGSMVAYAHASGASDLLLDEQEHWMEVAIKVDGRKEILPPVERSFSGTVLRAFKEVACLSTRAVPTWQTGAASFGLGPGRRADLRIEIAPTVHGESLVARVQDRERQARRMRRLPFTEPAQLALAESCLGRTQGLVVVSGPTGHGKTTTLYSCLGHLDRSRLNIRTLEDPVEFVVPWISQIPVGSGTGRDFGGGLRSLLRQAPHVILLGEIRDRESAQTCIEAVDTGHLILASLHARDTAGVVSRLLDLGVTGRQLGSALLLAIGQRLARRLCPACRRPVRPTPEQAGHFEGHGLPPPGELWEPAGCPACGGRGERGSAPVFEFLHPAGDLSERISRADRALFSERDLRAAWIGAGGSPLAREALRLAASGDISHAEARRCAWNPGD